MRKLLIGLAVLVSLAVITVLVGPGLIDWTAYRSQIERQLTGLFGRTVTIDGAVDFAVLPTPILTAEGVRVAGPTAEADPMLEIGALDARVAFAPLFSGRVRVESVTLDRPVVTVRRLPEGGTGWSGVLGRDAGGAGAVRLDRVAINDGTVRLRAVDGTDRLVLRQIFGQVSAESLAGPFEALGSVAVGGQALTVDLRTGRLSAAGALPVTVQLGVDGADAEARYAGLVGLDGRLQGEVRTSGSDLAGLLRRVAPARAVPASLARPFSLDGRVDGTPAAIQLNAVTAELGAIRATGALSLVPGDGAAALPQIDAALAVGRVDLDAFLDSDPAAPIDFAALGRALAAPEGGFALPDGLGVSLDATAEAVIWRGGLVRRVQAFAALADGAVTVDRLQADLPGSSRLDIAGRLDAAAGRPRVDGRVSLVSEDLRGLLGWLGLEPEGVTPSRLRRAQVAATVAGTAAELSVGGINAEIDGVALSGGLGWRAGDPAAGTRPGLGLRLRAGGRLDLDSYLPDGLRPVDAADLAGRLIALRAAPPVLDASLDLSADRLILAGLEMTAPSLEAGYGAAGLTVSAFAIGDVAGAGVQASGRLGPPDAETPILLDGTVTAADAGGLLAALGVPVPAMVSRLGPAEIAGRIAGGAAGLDLDGTLAALDGTLAVGGRIEDPWGAPGYDLALRVTLPEARALARAAAPAWQPRGPLGEMDLYAALTGGPEALTFGDLQGRAAGTSVAGSVTLTPGAPRPHLAAALRTGALDVTPLLPSAGMPALPGGAGPRWSSTRWPLDWLGAIDGRLALNAQELRLGDRAIADPALRLTLDDRVIAVARMDAGLWGGGLALDGRYDTGADPAALSGSVALTGAPLATVLAEAVGATAMDGTLDLRVDAASTGRSPAALIAGLTGEGLAAVRDGAIDGLDLADLGRRLDALDDPLDFVAVLDATVGSGRTPFDALNVPFAVEAGTATTERLRLAAPAAEGSGTGSLDLVRGRLDLVVDLTLARLADAPAFGLRLTGDPGDPRLRLETEALQAFLARRAAEALAD